MKANAPQNANLEIAEANPKLLELNWILNFQFFHINIKYINM